MTDEKKIWGPGGAVRRLLRRLAMFAALAALWYACQAYLSSPMRAARGHLSEVDSKSEKAIEARLKPLADLFDRGRKGAKPFAEESLSWGGKWEFVKSLVNGREAHRAYLSEAFARHVFTSDEVKDAMEACVRGYLDDLEGYEGEMLVKLRADLADPSRPADMLPAHLRSGEEFQKEYRRLCLTVVSDLRLDVGVAVGREIGTLVAADVATQAALQAARAAAAEMGVSVGLMGTGAAASVATLGVGLVVMFILDYVVDQVFKFAGYDPVEKIASMVRESIDKMQAALMRDPGYFSSAKKGALRLRLEELHEARSKLRGETVLRLVREGEAK